MREGVYYSHITDEIGIVTNESYGPWFDVNTFDYFFRVPYLELIFIGEL